MKIFLCAVISFILFVGACNQTPNQETEVRQAVQSFYDAFNKHEFENVKTLRPKTGLTSIRSADKQSDAKQF